MMGKAPPQMSPTERVTAPALLAIEGQAKTAGMPPLGMFGTGAKAAKLATPNTAIPVADQDSGYTPGKRDWMKEIGSDPLGFFLTGTDGLSASREEAILSDYARRAEAKEAERVQAQNAMLDSAGITGRERIAYLANPEKYGESYSTNVEAANISGGDSRSILGANGERTMITAPKFGVDGGFGYSQGPDGTKWGNRRGMSNDEETGRMSAVETGRNNRAEEGIARSRLDLDRKKAETDELMSRLPKSGEEIALVNQYLGEAKTFKEVRDAFNRVRGVGEATTPAEQMSLIFGYMKMLDPGSTVREGEYATAQNTTGLPGWLENAYNRAASGNFLNPVQVQEFVKQAGEQYKIAEGSYGKTLDQYKGRAERYRMPTEIIQDYRLGDTSQAPRSSDGLTSQGAADLKRFIQMAGLPETPEFMAQIESALGGSGDGPQPGEVEDGYRFLGGDRADPANWEPVQ